MKTLEFNKLSKNQKLEIIAISQNSFLGFCQIWYSLVKRQPFFVNWHHYYLCSDIDDLIYRDNSNRIINIPPGSSKTMLYCILLPAYCTALCLSGKLKKFRNFNISFNDSRLNQSADETREILKMPEFKELFGGVLKKDGKQHFNVFTNSDNNQTSANEIASIMSAPSGGGITGHRGGYLCQDDSYEFSGAVVLDDFQKPENLFSELKRETDNRKLTNTILSRRDDASEYTATPILNIQQRLHALDATNFMLQGGMGLDFKHIKIPAIITQKFVDELPDNVRPHAQKYIDNTPYKIVEGVKSWSYWEKKQAITDLLENKKTAPYTFYSQYMQEPQDLGGKLIDTSKIHRYQDLPELIRRVIIVDTNSGKEGDYFDKTVFLLVGVGVDEKVYVIDIELGTWSPSKLLKKSLELINKWHVTCNKFPVPLNEIMIEDKQAGQGLIVELKEKMPYGITVTSVGRASSKLVRHEQVIPRIYRGDLLIPDFKDKKDNIKDHIYYYSRGGVKPLHAATTVFLAGLMEELEVLDLPTLTNRSTKLNMTVAMGNKKNKKFDDQYDCIMTAVEELIIKTNNNRFFEDLNNFYNS